MAQHRRHGTRKKKITGKTPQCQLCGSSLTKPKKMMRPDEPQQCDFCHARQRHTASSIIVSKG